MRGSGGGMLTPKGAGGRPRQVLLGESKRMINWSETGKRAIAICVSILKKIPRHQNFQYRLYYFTLMLFT